MYSHSWPVPSLGLKTDAIPGLLNQTTSISTQPGLYYVSNVQRSVGQT